MSNLRPALHDARDQNLRALLALKVRGADLIETRNPAQLAERAEQLSDAVFRWEAKFGRQDRFIFERIA